MKCSLSLVTLASFGALAAAQTVQSKPFKLVVTTAGSKNTTTLASCHIGAGIESLCAGYGSSTYNLNTTKGAQAPIKGDSAPGVLTWLLPSEPTPYSQSMGLYPDITTNVGLATFGGLGEETSVAFDKNNLMNIISYTNDEVTPPTDDTPVAYYRWYLCEINFEGYVYNNLAWVYGKDAPQNPSCKKASVKRVFT